MEQFFLNTFPDGILIDDFAAGPCDVQITLTGDAWYEIAVLCHSGRQLTVVLWTTRKWRINTRMHDGTSRLQLSQTPQGDLQALAARDCGLHLEHMDRGHYWLGLDWDDGETFHIGFHAPYLKTKVLAHILPTPSA